MLSLNTEPVNNKNARKELTAAQWNTLKSSDSPDALYDSLSALTKNNLINLQWEIVPNHLTGRQCASLIKNSEFLALLSAEDLRAFVTAACEAFDSKANFGYCAFQDGNTGDFSGKNLEDLPLDLLLLIAKKGGSELLTRNNSALPGVIQNKLRDINLPWATVFVYAYLQQKQYPYYQDIRMDEALNSFRFYASFYRGTHFFNRESDQIIKEVQEHFWNYQEPTENKQETLEREILFLKEKMHELNEYYNRQYDGATYKDHSQEPKMRALEGLLSALIRSALISSRYKTEFFNSWISPVETQNFATTRGISTLGISSVHFKPKQKWGLPFSLVTANKPRTKQS